MYINSRETFERKMNKLTRKVDRLRRSLQINEARLAATVEAEKVINKLNVKIGDKVLHKKFKVCEVQTITWDSKGKIKLSVRSDETGWHNIVLRKAEVLNDTGYLLFEKIQEKKDA